MQKQSQTCANLWGGRFAAAPATRVECRLMCCNFCTSCKAWISPATSVPLRSKCCRFFMDAMIFNLPWDGAGLGTGYYQNIPELGHLRYLRRHTNSYDSGWLKMQLVDEPVVQKWTMEKPQIRYPSPSNRLVNGYLWNGLRYVAMINKAGWVARDLGWSQVKTAQMDEVGQCCRQGPAHLLQVMKKRRFSEGIEDDWTK